MRGLQHFRYPVFLCKELVLFSTMITWQDVLLMQEVLQQFAHVKDFVWCQEEPLNQGAWYCSQHHFREVIPFGASLRYAGRPASASPAVGYMSVHQKQQQDLVNDALNVE